jgi:hypothetical protein
MTPHPHISAPPDVSEDVARVLDDLAARRWSHLAEPVGVDAFEAILAGLGVVVSRYEVFVSPEKEQAQRAARRNNVTRPSLYQASEMSFHTDPGGIDLLAFYCAAQDETEGANLLIDLGDLDRHFDADEIDALGLIPVSYPVLSADGIDELHHLPLVSRRRGGLHIHYLPWGIVRPNEPALARMLDAFEEYVASRPVRPVRLQPGECLIIDNWRVLHGRGPLPPDSPRKLLRVHVRREPA